jgi:hypothetical protein
MAGFDYSRPLMKKVIVRPPTKVEAMSGVKEVPVSEIGMYLDEPGVFYNNQGHKIDVKVAMAPGGFTKDEVGHWLRMKEKADKLAAIEAEYAEQKAAVLGEPKSDGGDDGSQA